MPDDAAGATSDANRQLVEVFDRAAETYDSVIPFFRTFAELLVDFAEVSEGDSVLDVATGAGPCLVAAGRRAGPSARVVGTDLSASMVQRARKEATAAGMPDVPLAAAEGFRRVLRGGGRVGVSAPPDRVVGLGVVARAAVSSRTLGAF